MKIGSTYESLQKALKDHSAAVGIDQPLVTGQSMKISCVKGTRGFSEFQIQSNKSLGKKKFSTIKDAVSFAKRQYSAEICGMKMDGDIVILCDGKQYHSKDYESLNDLFEDVGNEFSITVTAKQDADILRYAVREEASFFGSANPIYEGRGFNGLQNAVHDIEEIAVAKGTVVLCLADSSASLTWTGHISTSWIMVDPCVPFDMTNGNPNFEKVSMDLPLTDYKVCLETRMAFYDRKNAIIYPIREMATPSIGKLLDAQGLFKPSSLDELPLGEAIVLANRLMNVDEFRFIYRRRSSTFKPLMGMCGKNFCMYSQEKLVSEAIDYCQSKEICYVDSFAVSDENTSVDIVVDTMNADYDIVINLQISDIPGSSIAATAYARLGTTHRTRVAIRRNSAYHRASFEKKGGIKHLFESNENVEHDNIFDAIDSFRKAYVDMQNKSVTYSEELRNHLLTPILELAGKRRRDELLAQVAEMGVAYGDVIAVSELFSKFVRYTKCKLPAKQSEDITFLYADLFNELAGKAVIVPKPQSIHWSKKEKEHGMA